MDYNLNKFRNLSGDANISSSKSLAHRYIIIASMINKTTIIKNVWESEDILATINICSTLNENIYYDKENRRVYINENKEIFLNNKKLLHAKNSGSTFRIISTMLLFSKKEFIIDAYEQMRKRDISDLLNLLKSKNSFPLRLKPLSSKQVEMDGKVSSQYISGAIIGLCLLNMNIKVYIKNITSLPYINLTINVLKNFGINVKIINNEIIIEKKDIKVNQEYIVETDITHAINFYVLQKFYPQIIIPNISKNSLQADTQVLQYIDNKYDVIDAINFPDSVPILCLYYGFKSQSVEIKNISKLIQKESNRIKSTIETLEKFNINIKYMNDSLIIKKSNPYLKVEKFISYDDHRIVFMLTIGALILRKKIIITNYEAINKSFPTFFDVINYLGEVNDKK